MTADVHQLVRRAVGDFVLGDNRVGDILLDVVKRREALRQFLQNRRVVALSVQRLPRRAGGLHQRRHFQQRLRGERRALFRQRQACAHVRNGTSGDAPTYCRMTVASSVSACIR